MTAKCTTAMRPAKLLDKQKAGKKKMCQFRKVDRYRKELIEAGLQFVRWLRNYSPELEEIILNGSTFSSFSDFIHSTPASFWGYIGDFSFDELTQKTSSGESIFDRVSIVVKEASPVVQGEILVSFVEAHMFSRPESPLVKELGETLAMDLSDLC